MPTIRDVADVLEAWAPRGSAQSYDNVGLQVGDAGKSISRGLIALDLTPQVIEEAKGRAADLIITHHPVIFNPLNRVVETDSFEALPYRLIRSGIAHYAIHTNADAAPDGVSFALAEQLVLNQHTLWEQYLSSRLAWRNRLENPPISSHEQTFVLGETAGVSQSMS